MKVHIVFLNGETDTFSGLSYPQASFIVMQTMTATDKAFTRIVIEKDFEDDDYPSLGLSSGASLNYHRPRKTYTPHYPDHFDRIDH